MAPPRAGSDKTTIDPEPDRHAPSSGRRGAQPNGGALAAKAFVGLGALVLAVAAALFLPAGTARWWRAWAYLVVFSGSVVLVTLDLLAHDRDLLRRRVRAGPAAEPRRTQQVVQALASLCFVATFVLAGLDRRLGGSSVPAAASAVADGVVAAGFGVVLLVFRENRHASAVVEVTAGQRVVATGPYRRVRHPMYAGALVLLGATPIALGSWIALVAVAALAGALVVRILDEERLLRAALPGYDAYCREVRYRLVPGVW